MLSERSEVHGAGLQWNVGNPAPLNTSPPGCLGVLRSFPPPCYWAAACHTGQMLSEYLNDPGEFRILIPIRTRLTLWDRSFVPLSRSPVINLSRGAKEQI